MAMHRWIQRLQIVLVVGAVAWWFLADRPLPFGSHSAPANALRAYIDAARREDCAAVVNALSTRSRELAGQLSHRLIVERAMCEYSPATAKLPDFETDRIRVEHASAATAQVSASYTYDRFFGFFGRGRARYTYAMVFEDGQWRVDVSESLDPESRPNQDRRAMFLIQQMWVAITDHARGRGELTDDPDMIRAQLPGFTFPEFRSGIADATAPAETPYVARVPFVAVCVSLRSASGTLVLVKIPPIGTGSTYQYGRIPSTCDAQPLARPYHGSSSGIR